jgi:hypothetical protein
MLIPLLVTLDVEADDDGYDTAVREATRTVCDALAAADLAATVSGTLATVHGVDPRMRGGYVNRHGRTVPNPCCGLDAEGRDLDRIYRNIKPGDRWDKETLDRLASGPL